MNKSIFIATAVIMFLCCSIFYFSCDKKEYHDLNARLSPEWVKNAVIYEINLRSISKNISFKVLEEQIPELTKLGITVISLMSIHPIGELNRKGILGSRYAVKDFYSVNTEFGTLEDFKSLVNATHQQGLKIIIDLVVNQATWDSQLLLEHPDWFVHNEEGAIVSPSAERSDVAQIDYKRHEPRKYMIAMMKFWVQEIGIDGFQCLTAELIPADFWNVARNELDKIKPVLMISESMLPKRYIKAFDLTCSRDINNILTKIIDGNVSASIINDSLNAEFLQFSNELSHLQLRVAYNENIEDTPDIEKSNQQSAQVNAVLSFTFPGVPLICSVDKFNEDLITFRRNHQALRYGKYQTVQNSDISHIFSFIRFSGNDSVITVINFANSKKEAVIQMPAGSSLIWKNQFSGINFKVKDSRLRIGILPSGFIMLAPSSEKEIL